MLRGNKFVEYACFQYGAYNAAISGEPDAHYISDFQYFVFVKSTKSLKSIRTLLDMGHIEDVFILLRTMFEGYLDALLEKIVVYADKTIELRWKFSNRRN